MPNAAKNKSSKANTSGGNDNKPKLPDPVEFAQTLAQITERSQRIVSEFLRKYGAHPESESFGNLDVNKMQQEGIGMADPANIGWAFFEMSQQLLRDPQKMIDAQTRLTQKTAALWQNTMERFMNGEAMEPMIEPERGDRRFKDEAWSENAWFDFLKQSYLMWAETVQDTVSDVEGLDKKTAHKVDFYTRQYVDALSPSNFLITNPEVLRSTLESGGDNLLRGLQNLIEDYERGEGKLAIKMSDDQAFEVGKNIAVTAGKVVFENKMLQLIQYAPTTKQCFKRPLLIVPPWINKYYILDLTPENSFVKWAVDQGHTVFMISWVNPDETYRDKSFADYMKDGVFEALDAVSKATGEKDANVIGYCIGGTLLACALAYMAEKKDTRVKSATYFTTLLDFSDPGDLAVFIDEEQIESLENRMNTRGYLEGHEMATTFNMLRSNDLIWSFVINNYLLGKEPFPFDLLYWNSDSTRMPAAMHSFYLRNMYLNNKLRRKGGIKLDGVAIDLSKVKTPSFMISTKDDHIAPWKSTYSGIHMMNAPVKFVLAASGHIAGVVNHPSRNKYAHWLDMSNNAKHPENPDDWFDKAEKHEGSWWPEWQKWIEQHAGGKMTARKPGDGKLKAIESAPGKYVKAKS